MSSHIAEAFLEHDLIHQFQDLLTMVETRDERFFWWNDIYFMNRCQELRIGGKLKDHRVSELTEMLLYRHAPKTINHPLFAHRIIADDGSQSEKEKLTGQIRKLVAELERVIEKHGSGKEWILADIPEKDVVFAQGLDHLVKKRKSDNLYRERDPIRIVNRRGEPRFLVERENSLMKHLSGFVNFVPSVYCNEAALKLFKNRGLIE